MVWWALFAAGWLAASLCAYPSFRTVRFLRGNGLRRRARELPEPPAWPKVSVVVPARDEAGRVEAALRSLARLDYPSLEVIAVDDRSRDETGAILDRVAAGEPRVAVLRIRDLPEGWLGKSHALQAGARRATGELLLFTDADVVHAPDTLRLAVRYLLGCRIDHLALLPGLSPGGYWEDAAKVYFAMLLVAGLKTWAAGSRSKDAYVGVGAFNLLRRPAYDAIGGHESLRLEVADDLMLGRRIKAAGLRQGVLVASDHLRLRWQEGVGGFIRGLEKNGFAALGYSVPSLLLVTVLAFLYYAIPYAGAAAFRDARASGYVFAVLVMHAAFGFVASPYRNGWLVAPALPCAACIYFFALWRSAVVTIRRRGVRWRDTFYPLELLKKRRDRR